MCDSADGIALNEPGDLPYVLHTYGERWARPGEQMILRQNYGACALCLLSLSCYANEADIIIEIDSRSPTPINEASAFSKVITRADIARSGYQSLSEVLAGSGLLHIGGASSGYDAGGSPDLRGFGERAAQNILILLNGRPLNNATLEGPDLSTIPLDEISRVEILNASAGVLYGNGAVGGVVNIISDQTVKREYSESKIKAGSFGTFEVSTNISRSLEAGRHLHAAASAGSTDGYRDHTENTKSYGAVSYSLPFLDGDVSFGLDQSRTDGYLSGVVADGAVKANRRAYRTTSVQKKRSIRQTIWTKLENTLDTGGIFQIDAGRRLSRQEGRYLNGTSIDQILRVNSLSPKVLGQTSLDSKPTDYVFGIDLSQSQYLTGNSNVRTQEIGSFFGRAKITMAEQLDAILGARMTHNTNKLLNGAKVNNDVIAVELGLEKLVDDQIFSLRLDQNFRIATLDEQVTYPAPAFSATDTPIAPQKGNSVELGWKSGATQATIYHLETSDEIYYDPAGFTNTTVDKTKRYGGSFSTDASVTSSIKASISGSYIYAKFDDDTYDGSHVPSTSRYLGSLGLVKTISDQWSVGMLSRYQSAQYSINDWSNAYGRQNAYSVTNLNVSHVGKFFSSKVTIGNLFGKEYDSYHLRSGANLFRTPAAPRSLVFEISASL